MNSDDTLSYDNFPTVKDIYLNGSKVSGVVTCNLSEGWVEISHDPLRIFNDEVVTYRASGSVQIELKEGSWYVPDDYLTARESSEPHARNDGRGPRLVFIGEAQALAKNWVSVSDDRVEFEQFSLGPDGIQIERIYSKKTSVTVIFYDELPNPIDYYLRT